MADVSWIRLDVNLLDSRKVKSLRRMDFGDAAVITWIFLLTTAGKCNDGGRIFIDEDVPYAVEDIADELGYDPQITEAHLAKMMRLHMIEMDDDGFFHVCGWEDHQSADRLAELKEMHRERQRRYAEKKKNDVTNDVSNDVSMTSASTSAMESADALDKDIDIEKDLYIERDKEQEKDMNIKNKKTGIEIENKEIREESAERGEKGEERKNVGDESSPRCVRHLYGEFKHVRLTDEQMDNLKAEFPSDWQDWIRQLDEWIEMKGDSYKNHLLTIKNWARRRREKGEYRGQSAGGTPGKNSKANEWAYLDNLI